MGDVRRFEVFADWIEERFPPDRFRRVLDVAGGGGMLALELADRGYMVKVVDPRKSRPPARERRSRRNLLGLVEYVQERFQPSMATEADLVIGLHPDGATKAICEAVDHAPVVIVPCCNYWPGHDGDVTNAVRAELSRRGACMMETTLPMNGRNLLIRGQI